MPIIINNNLTDMYDNERRKKHDNATEYSDSKKKYIVAHTHFGFDGIFSSCGLHVTDHQGCEFF